jgi:RNA ligase (TIGR02306 family)
MSTFGVTVEFLENIRSHPDADRLELAGLAGCDYQFVIPKGVYKNGDPVLYFPVDAILPEPLLERVGLSGKLGGAKKNRVKTKKIRGAPSQGIVQSVYDFPELGFTRQ